MSYEDHEAFSRAEFDKALRGERQVYCLVCGQAYNALDVTPKGGAFRTIWPAAHNSPPPISRARCRGSEMQALLEPRQ